MFFVRECLLHGCGLAEGTRNKEDTLNCTLGLGEHPLPFVLSDLWGILSELIKRLKTKCKTA